MAAGEEYEESEIIFSDNSYFIHQQFDEMDREISRVFSMKKKKNMMIKQSTNKKSATVPVNIPSNAFKLSDSDEEESDDGEEIVPPHLIIGRRIEGKMAFSVCTGNGRTLKGRDLSQVRNSILRLTGFLEA